MKRAEARQHGLIRYSTGKPCANGHDADRYTKSGKCTECVAIRCAKRPYDPEYRRAYHLKNRHRAREQQQAWRAANKERVQENYRKNRKAVRARHLEYYATPEGRGKKLRVSARLRARTLKVPFDLTAEWVAERLESGCCEITSIPFELELNGSRSPFAPSIDRIEADGGYTMDNCRVVCWLLNAVLGDWGMGPVMRVAEELVSSYPSSAPTFPPIPLIRPPRISLNSV